MTTLRKLLSELVEIGLEGTTLHRDLERLAARDDMSRTLASQVSEEFDEWMKANGDLIAGHAGWKKGAV